MARQAQEEPRSVDRVAGGQDAPVGYHSHASLRDRGPASSRLQPMDRTNAGPYQYVLDTGLGNLLEVATDPNCWAQLKDYRSLMPMAQGVRKPMFLLRPADGAFGGHQQAVQSCYGDFKALTLKIMERCGLPVA